MASGHTGCVFYFLEYFFLLPWLFSLLLVLPLCVLLVLIPVRTYCYESLCNFLISLIVLVDYRIFFFFFLVHKKSQTLKYLKILILSQIGVMWPSTQPSGGLVNMCSRWSGVQLGFIHFRETWDFNQIHLRNILIWSRKAGQLEGGIFQLTGRF